MLKWLIALMVGFLCLTECHSRELIKELEDNGEVVGAGRCQMANTAFDCVQVTYEGNLYSVLGTIKGDEFFALYVVKKIGDDWHIVWSWRNST